MMSLEEAFKNSKDVQYHIDNASSSSQANKKGIIGITFDSFEKILKEVFRSGRESNAN